MKLYAETMHWFGLHVFALLAVFIGAAGPAHASAITWNVSGDGTWDTTTPNWTGDSTTFTSDGTVDVFFTGGAEFPGNWTITCAAGVLPKSITFNNPERYVLAGGPIAGGAMIYNGPGPLRLATTPANLSGFTINGGTVFLDAADGFAPGGVFFQMTNVTINGGGVLQGYRAHIVGDLTMNGGRYFEYNGFGGSWNGPIHLAADSYFGDTWYCYRQELNGKLSGPGGFTWDSLGDASLILAARNSYYGNTIVNGGTLECRGPSSLGYGGALTVASGAKVYLNYKGDHSVPALTLGGVAQLPGTYGSSSSPAAIQDDTYFAGTGTVTCVGDARITSFDIAGNPGSIDQAALTIEVLVPDNLSMASLSPSYTVNSGTCNQTNGAPPSPTFAAANPAVYTVTDGTTTNQYAVTVLSTRTFNLGNWPLDPGTSINGGVRHTWIPQGTLPSGSILRQVAFDIVTTDGDCYVGDLCLYLDATPGDTGDSNALRVGDGDDGGNEPAATVVRTNMRTDTYGPGTWGTAMLTAADGIPALDLNVYEVFLANGYGNGAWDGTITLVYDAPAPSPPSPVLTITGISRPGVGGDFTISATASSGATVGLFRGTNLMTSIADWTQSGASQTGTAFSIIGTGGGSQGFFIIKQSTP